LFLRILDAGDCVAGVSKFIESRTLMLGSGSLNDRNSDIGPAFDQPRKLRLGERFDGKLCPSQELDGSD
jgi:hypothetical protein